MAAHNMYKFLLLLQSALFIVATLVYFQKSSVIRSPAGYSLMQNTTKQCNCPVDITRLPVPCEADNVSHAISQPVPVRKDDAPAKSQLVPGKPPPDSVRGPWTNCSLDDIKERPGVVLLTTANLAFLDVALNMLMSVRKTGVCVNTTIIGEDRQVYEQLSQRLKNDPTVTVLLTDSGEMDAIEHPRSHGSQYYGLMNKRQAYVLKLLEQGYEVLFSDADTFWFRDPFPFFQGEFDISLIDSVNPLGVRSSRSNFCAGFIYFRPTDVTLQFIRAWVKALDDNKRRGSFTPDQTIMNGLLKNDRPVYVKIKPLDTNIFPYGPKFYSLRAKKANYSTVVMHAASIRGHAAKLAKFQSSNMWLVNKTTEELVAEK